MRHHALVLGLVLLAASAPLCAQVTLPAIYGEGVVLQRHATVHFGGHAPSGAEVVVTPDWCDPLVAEADAEGRWSVPLATPEAGGPHEIAIASAGTELMLRDVLVGEVWLCSGQSNMQWPLLATDEAEAAIAASADAELRLFEVDRAASADPRDDCGGAWHRAAPGTTRSFSAVAYHFGRTLRAELDVPVGLVVAAWGGTPAESWTTEEALRALGGFDAALDGLDRYRGDATALRAESARALRAWWTAFDRDDPGFAAGWSAPDYDDRDWETMTLPAEWDGALAQHDGTVWFRRTITIPDSWAGRAVVLETGPIDDMDEAYLDGAAIGTTHEGGRWNQPRRYAVPAERVHGGRAVLCIRAYDAGGAGRVGDSGTPMRLRRADDPEGAEALDLAGAWRLRRGRDAMGWPPAVDASPGPREPAVLANGMLAPVERLPVRGAIWYQGESNVGRAEQYRALFPAMIADWRAQRGSAFPFLFVQIAPFRYGGTGDASAALRDAQRDALALDGTGMVVTTDLGDPTDIHPRAKRPVGERLARLALARVYGQSIPAESPLVRDARRDGSRVRVRFDHAEGLTTTGGAPDWFEVAGTDGLFHPAAATIDGATVLLDAAGVEHPVSVRFGWSDDAVPNLVNGAGLPASPFRIEIAPGGA